jgi:hypothetical protein
MVWRPATADTWFGRCSRVTGYAAVGPSEGDNFQFADKPGGKLKTTKGRAPL